MRAFERAPRRRPDLDLRLDSSAASTRRSRRRSRDRRRGRAHPPPRYVPDDEARALVAAAHATVFMSLYEGFGLPIAESLWQGTPCLCSDHGSMAEIAKGGGCLMIPRNGFGRDRDGAGAPGGRRRAPPAPDAGGA